MTYDTMAKVVWQKATSFGSGDNFRLLSEDIAKSRTMSRHVMT